MEPPRKRAKRARTEAQHQKDFVFYVRALDRLFPRLRGRTSTIRMTAPCNGLPTRHGGVKIEARKMGMMCGVPDLIFSHPREVDGRVYHGLFIEMKAPNGALSQSQREYIADLEMEGYRVEVCYGAMEAVMAFNEYFGVTETEFHQAYDDCHIREVLDRVRVGGREPILGDALPGPTSGH